MAEDGGQMFPPMPRSRVMTRDWRRWVVAIGGIFPMMLAMFACMKWVEPRVDSHWSRFAVYYFIPLAFGQIYGALTKPLIRRSRAELAAAEAEWREWEERVSRLIRGNAP